MDGDLCPGFCVGGEVTSTCWGTLMREWMDAEVLERAHEECHGPRMVTNQILCLSASAQFFFPLHSTLYLMQVKRKKEGVICLITWHQVKIMLFY